MGTRRYKVLWAEPARDDLLTIARYVARDSEQAALAVIDAIQERALSLCQAPRRGRIVPELERSGVRVYRELLCPPWRIVYRVSGQTVLVLAVLDSRRSLEDLLLGRLLPEK